jgi:hypothetical protein
MGAGLITALLFVVAQWATNPDIKHLAQGVPPGLQSLAFFELELGFRQVDLGVGLQYSYGPPCGE